MKFDFLIVGAGFAGSVLAERLASSGKKVWLVEQRDHVGGNCYDYSNENGILVHKYGPHIFHTKSKEVWEYLSQFTEWFPYRHRVLSHQGDKNVSLPVSLKTIDELFDQGKAKVLKDKLINSFGEGKKVPIFELMGSNDADISKFGEEVYKRIYLNYSMKQWGMDPSKLDGQVLNRVPIWVDYDDSYFKDKYQGMPKQGYTKMLEKMLDNPKISVTLGKDYKEVIDRVDYGTLIYTGPIDYFFDYKYGKLPYRSLRFEFETLDMDKYQDAAVVNYSGSEPFTRLTEFKHFGEYKMPKTTILKEYPEDYISGKNVPCYSIPKNENFKMYRQYQAEADKLDRVVFVGRLAEYKYYNMDEVVERALRF